MGTVKRLNERLAQQKDAENAMPGAYESQYAGGIADALAAMGDQNTQGLGADAGNSGYLSALGRLNSNAQAGADAAAATAQALSGGYGAQWADSAANQAAAAQTGQTAGLMASARADALSQWQRELSGKSSLVDTLLGQNALERSEYDGSVANAADWRSYLSGRTQQARQENSDFWGNVWNAVKGGVSTLMQGYDAYKGYSQQKWENDFAERQYNDSLSRTQLSDQMAALQQAANYKQAGFDDAAKQILNQYGLTDTMLDSWQGLSQVDKDKLDYLTTAAGLAGSGYDTAANNYLTMAGLPTGSVDSYSTIANRVNQAELAKYAGQQAISSRYKTTTGSGGRSSSSGSKKSTSAGSGSSGTGFTNTQLQTMATKFQSMKETDPLYPFYKQTLTDAGWLQGDSTADSGSTAAQSGSGRQSVNTGSGGTGGNTSRLPSGTKYPWQTMGTADAVAGASEKVGSTKNGGFDAAVAKAQSMENDGYSMDQISEYLIRMGYSDNVISRVSNVMGW